MVQRRMAAVERFTSAFVYQAAKLAGRQHCRARMVKLLDRA